MLQRGRKRKANPTIPPHVDQHKLPNNCYWDNSGRGHWYTTYKDERGKQRRKRITNRDATLSDLHKIIEEWNGIERGTFRWLAELYFHTKNYLDLTRSTRTDYQYSNSIIESFPTRTNKHLADIPIRNWDSALVQKLVDKLSDKPTKAKHVHGFVRIVFRWGLNRGYCTENPAVGTELPKERKLQRLPSQKAYDRLLNYAKENGTFGQRQAGTCPHYIWPVMELEYLCRLRGVECRNIMESDLLGEGLIAYRRKGSKTNITQWNHRLQSAVDYLLSCRKQIWESHKTAVPLNPEARPLIVNTMGEQLGKNAYNSAWQRFIKGCINSGIVNVEDRFSLHDLKRKGVTDTSGTDQEKMDASGHRDTRMLAVYDKSIKVVKPASE